MILNQITGCQIYYKVGQNQLDALAKQYSQIFKNGPKLFPNWKIVQVKNQNYTVFFEFEYINGNYTVMLSYDILNKKPIKHYDYVDKKLEDILAEEERNAHL